MADVEASAGKRKRNRKEAAVHGHPPHAYYPPPPPYAPYYVPYPAYPPPPPPQQQHAYIDDSEDSDGDTGMWARDEKARLVFGEDSALTKRGSKHKYDETPIEEQKENLRPRKYDETPIEEQEDKLRSHIVDENVLMLDEIKSALLKIKHSDVGEAIFTLSPKIEQWVFLSLLAIFQAALIAVYGVWFDYIDDSSAVADFFYYPYFRDVAVMIFFGFGLLMAFIRRNGFNAIGFTIVFSSLAIQWSVVLGHMMQKSTAQFEHREQITMLDLLNGLFCAGAVMITYGGSLGKITPIQMLLITFVEPILYWLNIYVIIEHLEAHDVGGGMTIHTFGCYFGLAVAWFLTSRGTRNHPDGISSYVADILSATGSIFLWIMWPSFNAAIAEGTHDGTYSDEWARNTAALNTVLALVGSAVSVFVFSPLNLHGKFDPVHLVNASLAGGVVMGTAADLKMFPATALGAGFVAGAVSVLGYRYVQPFLNKWLFLQDVCGINNLHGMPGVLGAVLCIFLTAGICHNDPGQCPRGKDQAAYQLAALAITIGIAVGGGIVTGFLCMLLKLAFPIRSVEWFNDRVFWESASDYDDVVNQAEERPGYWTRRKSVFKERARNLVSIVRTKIQKRRGAGNADSDADSDAEANATEMQPVGGKNGEPENDDAPPVRQVSLTSVDAPIESSTDLSLSASE